MDTFYKVSGCGIAAICPEKDVITWIQEIIAKNGTPSIIRCDA